MGKALAKIQEIFKQDEVFKAPTGAQEMLMFVRSSVRPVQVCLEQSIFIILAQIFKQSVRNKSAVNEQSESTQEHSASNQRAISKK